MSKKYVHFRVGKAVVEFIQDAENLCCFEIIDKSVVFGFDNHS